MSTRIHALTIAAAFLLSAASTTGARAQVVAPGAATLPPGAAPLLPPASTAHAPIPHYVVPQVGRAVGMPAIAVTDVAAVVEITGVIATTTLEVGVRNVAQRPEEAVLLVPVPAGATVTGFTFQGSASESTARFMPADEARRTYDSIVAKVRDPALLEWAGWNLLRSSVFPVPAGGTQRVRITWEVLLGADGDRLDYALPRSDLSGGPPWQVEVRVHAKDVAAVYSPSHELTTTRTEGLVVARSKPSGPGAFRLSVVRAIAPTASVLAYPDPAAGGGFFMMLVAAPAAQAGPKLHREVTLVLDRSGSMAGAPFERAKAAALRILDGMDEGDSANIIDFSNGVTRFADAPVALNAATRQALRAHVAALLPNGGTNIHDALLEALRQPAPPPGTLGTVLFVTDGVPTIGRTREADIRALAERANPAARRVFTVGLGNDVNVPLLDRIADETRAVATYLDTDQDLTTKLAEVGERLRGPVLTDAALVVQNSSGAATPGRTDEVLPQRLPDVFRGGTLVVLGRYRGEDPFTLAIDGRSAAGPMHLAVAVDPRQASTANAFIPRLWASRRIAVLVDEIRQQGLDALGAATPNDPRWRELSGEIVRLSTTYGILTEYTAMLALEGSSFHDMRALEAGCLAALNGRAVGTRTGGAAVNQGVNWNRQKLESAQSATTNYVDAKGAQVEARAMNQCADKTFYRVGQAWADASLAGTAATAQEEVAYGSDRHRQVLWELVAEGRQSALALEGDVLLQHRGRTILVHNGAAGAQP